ncbi:hypothetical protein [Piscinibacterium candidicorallinum]|uniref:Uncharacterized protein n=1 Tax=Piscinibacterium candidicorallinum TaxID=1793872 RepID=A0ABV7H357_9BURK
MRAVDNSTLARWRAMESVKVLSAVADHAKRDRTFQPVKDPGTERWHAAWGHSDFELLVCGPKFYDTRSRRGGGGAVDLVMHLTGKPFKQAVELLRDAGL